METRKQGNEGRGARIIGVLLHWCCRIALFFGFLLKTPHDSPTNSLPLSTAPSLPTPSANLVGCGDLKKDELVLARGDPKVSFCPVALVADVVAHEALAVDAAVEKDSLDQVLVGRGMAAAARGLGLGPRLLLLGRQLVRRHHLQRKCVLWRDGEAREEVVKVVDGEVEAGVGDDLGRALGVHAAVAGRGVQLAGDKLKRLSGGRVT